MARRVNRKDLCEAIRQSQARMQDRMQETGGSERPVEPEVPRFQLKQPVRKRSKRPLKSYIPVQLRSFRLAPRYLGAVIGIVVFIIGVVWLGRAMNNRQGDTAVALSTEDVDSGAPAMHPAARSVSTDRDVSRPASGRTVESVSRPSLESVQSAPAEASDGDHVIVIATYVKREQLIPVQDYFRSNGIATEIMRRGSYYLLVTRDRFESPRRTGSDGYRMLQKIRSVGAGYKAPGGYESFGRTPFQDAYGMKVK